MTIHKTANYQIAYCDTDTAAVDLAAASQQAAQTIDAALGRGGVAPVDATSLATEAGTRRDADTALSARIATLEAAPAWLTLTGAPPFGSTYQPPQYRRVGDMVQLRGLVAASPGNNVVFSTLPPGFRPAKSELFPMLISGEWLDVNSNGTLSRSGTNMIPLTGISFSVTA